jgi:hypothetical protein
MEAPRPQVLHLLPRLSSRRGALARACVLCACACAVVADCSSWTDFGWVTRRCALLSCRSRRRSNEKRTRQRRGSSSSGGPSVGTRVSTSIPRPLAASTSPRPSSWCTRSCTCATALDPLSSSSASWYRTGLRLPRAIAHDSLRCRLPAAGDQAKGLRGQAHPRDTTAQTGLAGRQYVAVPQCGDGERDSRAHDDVHVTGV